MGEPGLRMDTESYLAFERSSDEKHELWDGEVFAMAGASLAHNWIVGNLVHEFTAALTGRDCKALPSDMRVRIPTHDRYVYPDVTVVCGPPQLEGEADVLLNPSTIVEVLSPSTAAFDRGDKFTGYRSIPSVQEILFVSQDQARIEAYTRQADGSWVLREYGRDDSLPLLEVAAPLPLRSIYAGVTVDGLALV